MIKAIPKPGLKVHMPEGGYLPPQGAEVERNTYWRRRIKEGSVTEGKVKAPKANSIKIKKTGEENGFNI